MLLLRDANAAAVRAMVSALQVDLLYQGYQLVPVLPSQRCRDKTGMLLSVCHDHCPVGRFTLSEGSAGPCPLGSMTWAAPAASPKGRPLLLILERKVKVVQPG